jgi:hypothetical protein
VVYFYLKVVHKMSFGYGHLYDTSVFVPPSVQRQYESALPSDVSNSVNGIAMVKGNHQVGEINTMENFISQKLQNKDVYQKMKNKTVYSSNVNVMAHAGLNQL